MTNTVFTDRRSNRPFREFTQAFLLVECMTKYQNILARLSLRMEGRGWVRHMFGRRSGVLCVLSLIYILW